MDRKSSVVCILAAVGIASVVAAAPRASDRVLYNHSPSIDVGFYLRTDQPPRRGAIVTVRARDVAPVEARARKFDGPSDRFIKRVVAVSDQRVCGDGAIVSVDGVVVARAHLGHGALQTWVGCRTLRSGEVLLLGDSPDSFDGRYWGPVSGESIEGVWRRM